MKFVNKSIPRHSQKSFIFFKVVPVIGYYLFILSYYESILK